MVTSLLFSTWLAETALVDSSDEKTCTVLLLAISLLVNWFCVTAAVELRAESSDLFTKLESLTWYSELILLAQMGFGATGGGTFFGPDVDRVFVAVSDELILI